MKVQEIILDVIGLALIALSIYDFYFRAADFMQSTLIGVAGLSLLVLKGSQIRKIVEKLVDKYLNK